MKRVEAEHKSKLPTVRKRDQRSRSLGRKTLSTMRRIQRNLPNPARSHSARSSKSSGLLVPEEGVEPTRPCGQRILSPPRLPFRHSGRGKTQHNTQSRSGSTPSQGLAFATQSPRKSQPSNFRHPGTLSSVVSLFVIDSCVISVVKFAMKLSLHSPP